MNLRQLLLLSLILLHGTVFASTADAEKRLQTAVNEVLTVAESAPSNESLIESLRPILKKYLNFDAMTRRAIGPGWRQFTADQQEEAIKLFTTLVIRTYAGKFTIGEHPVIQFKPASTPSPGRVEVPTTNLYKGNRYNVTYRLEDDKGWFVTDVVIEGVSLVANYRAQFETPFQKGGAKAILSALTRSVSNPD
ncbi:MAG: ABC transporter substrate-binding protein [Chthoniobacterales bacterium]|nr:ABC transporter substrate-binding protein [Chthoniobacterales bacterium]